MSEPFDDHLLRSVLSGSAPSSKENMPKVGEIGVGESSEDTLGTRKRRPIHAFDSN